MFASLILQFTASMREFKVQLALPAANICGYLFIVSSRVSTPPWNINLTPFCLAPLKTILNLSDPSFYEQPSLKILENFTPSPLKSTFVWKSSTHFLKKQKTLFPTLKNKNTFECWNMKNIQLQNLKIKEDLGAF